MVSRFTLKRSNSFDTADTFQSVDSADVDATFVDRVRINIKKAASPFSTLFVAGTNRPTTNTIPVVREKRGGISLSALVRKGSDHDVKAESCENSVHSQETADIWNCVDSTVGLEHKEHEDSCHDDEESYDENKEYDYCYAGTNDEDIWTKDSAIVLKRRLHRRSSFDDEFRRREDDRRSARATAAALVRKRNSQRQASHGGQSHRHSETHRSHCRHIPATRKNTSASMGV